MNIKEAFNFDQINESQIYLYDENYQKFFNLNPMKEFFNFLKSYNRSKVIEFCYSYEKDSLHQNLTIKENFILDAVPKSLIRDGEDNFKQFLLALKNPYTKELVFFIQDLNAKIQDLSKEQLKLVSITKSLLSQSEYVFMLAPDEGLRTEAMQIIKKAIEFEAYQRKRCILIKPYNRDLWLDIAEHIIFKCNKSLKYYTKKNSLYFPITKLNLETEEKADLVSLNLKKLTPAA